MEAHALRGGTQHTRKMPGGGALLWVILLGILVVGVITVGQKFLGWGSPGDPDECPWLETDRIVGFGGSVALPAAPKPDLKKWSSFRVSALCEGQPQGHLQVEISEEGLVTGGWKAEYEENKRTYTFDAGFAGNVDVSKTYVDASGHEDPSQLYLIAQGRYTKQAYSKSAFSGVGGGEAYLTGWLGPDGKGHGKITLVFDKKVTKLLTWER